MGVSDRARTGLAGHLPPAPPTRCARSSPSAPPRPSACSRSATLGEGGDRTLVIDAAAEDAVFAAARAPARRRAALHRGQRGARRGRLRRPRTRSSSSTRSTARSTPSAGCRTTRSRSRSPTARTMADVVFGYVYDFGAGRGVDRARAARARGSTAAADPGTPASAAAPTGGSSSLGDRVGRPALGARVGRRPAPSPPTACARWGRSPRRSARWRRRGSTAWSTLRRCRAVDVAAAQLIVREGGGLVAFPACDDPLGAPLDLPPHSPIVAARTEATLAELAGVPTM